MRAKLLIPIVVLAAIAVAALAGVFSSGDTSPATLGDLQNAASATAQTTGVHLALAVTTAGGPEQVSVSGGGEMDPATREANITLSMNASGTQSSQMTMTEILKDGTLYLESPLLSEHLPGGQRWVSVDLQQLQRSLGVSPASDQFGVDPSQYLDYLRAAGAQVTAAGTQSLRGETVTLYTGTINIVHAIELSAGPAGAQAASKVTAEMRNASAVPVEAWVGADHRLRKLAMSLETQGAVTQRVNVVAEYFDFGPIKPVAAPPAGEVFDLTEQVLSHLP